MPDAEMSAIMRTLVDTVKTYEQVAEVCRKRLLFNHMHHSSFAQLLSYLVPQSGGLLQLAYGLFHQKETVRESTVDLFNRLRAFPVRV